MKKHYFFLAAALLGSIGAGAQSGNFGIGTTTPGTTLDVAGGFTLRETAVVVSSNAVTIPANISLARITGAATAAVAISAPTPSNAGQHLTIYNNTSGGFGATLGSSTIRPGEAANFVYTAGAWRMADNGLSANPGWSMAGSTGTTAGTHFIGTADSVDFVSKTNGAERLRITAAGKTGIGTSSPGNVLEVSGTGGTGTGLKLPTGAASGKVLTSDVSGNASWQTGYVVSYSEIHGTGNNTDYAANVKITGLSTTTADNVKAIYGSSYGWDNTNKRWIAPVNGKYRVTVNGYFNNNNSNVNPRIYAYKNGTIICGLVSVTQPSGAGDIASSTSAIIALSAGEWVEFRAGPSGGIRLYMGEYHTFIRVESVE